MSGKKDSEPRGRPEEYDRFDDLMGKLMRVRKSELDEAVKNDKAKRAKSPPKSSR